MDYGRGYLHCPRTEGGTFEASYPTTYTVVTDVGTFTRTSAREYTHAVVCLTKADDNERPDQRGRWGLIGFRSRLDLAMREFDYWSERETFAELRVYDIDGRRVR